MSLASNIQKQLNNMIAFIDQEAGEKVEEIYSKTEEEFNIEKGHIIHQQRLKIMEDFDKKEKKVEYQKRIQTSKIFNQGRLKLLSAQDDIFNDLLCESKNHLVEMTQNKTRYKQFLKLLIIQGLLKLLEPIVFITIRKLDQTLVMDILDEVKSKYKELTKKEISLQVDTKSNLPSNCAGGIVLHTLNNRIAVSNTLEDRLNLTFEKMIPELKSALFGPNPNRKHLT